jgi:hypothetical protein
MKLQRNKLIQFKSFHMPENSLRSIMGGAIETCTEEYDCKDSLLKDGMTVWPEDLPCSEEHAECDSNC